MKNRFFSGSILILIFFLIPYVSVIIFNGADIALINRNLDVEMVLPAVLASQIDSNYELETIKAQAIIARSNIYRCMEEKEEVKNLIEEIRKKFSDSYYYFSVPNYVYEKAVTETKGKVLTYNNELKMIPYHKVSAGATRDGKECFHDEKYSYLQSVDSSIDKKSDEYLNCIYININQLPDALKIKTRDSAGYVTELLADGNVLEGESFRKGMGLTSSNFTAQKIGEKIRFICKGKGHGFGLSQDGGNELAKNKSTGEEILAAYFPAMEIRDISDINLLKD